MFCHLFGAFGFNSIFHQDPIITLKRLIVRDIGVVGKVARYVRQVLLAINYCPFGTSTVSTKVHGTILALITTYTIFGGFLIIITVYLAPKPYSNY